MCLDKSFDRPPQLELALAIAVGGAYSCWYAAVSVPGFWHRKQGRQSRIKFPRRESLAALCAQGLLCFTQISLHLPGICETAQVLRKQKRENKQRDLCAGDVATRSRVGMTCVWRRRMPQREASGRALCRADTHSARPRRDPAGTGARRARALCVQDNAGHAAKGRRARSPSRDVEFVTRVHCGVWPPRGPQRLTCAGLDRWLARRSLVPSFCQVERGGTRARAASRHVSRR